MNGSLRRRLTIAVVAATAPLMAALALILYRAVADAEWERFDDELIEDARVMADLVEFERGGYDLEIHAIVRRFDEDPDAATEFQLWRADGSPLLPDRVERGSLRASPASIEEPELWKGELSSGAPAGFVGFRFTPHRDEEEDAGVGEVAPLSISLGRDTRMVDALLGRLTRWFWMLGTGMVVVSSGVAGLAVSRGLRPLSTVAHEIARIDERNLDRTLDLKTVPEELRPLVGRLNTLLLRLSAAFARERQFSANVAHELRTPLAILRASVDVTRREPTASEAVVERLGAMAATVDETTRMVEMLLELARSEDAVDPLELDAIDVGDLVDQEWTPHHRQAVARRLTFRNHVAAATYVETDRAKLRRITSNLLSNAASYTESGGWVEVRSNPAAGVVVEVRDSGPPIPEDQLPRLFDRFWRADRARTNVGEHAGIGLALTRSLARRLGYEVVASNHGREVRFTVARTPA